MNVEGKVETETAADRKQRKSYQGVVIADNRDKTIKVGVERVIKHPRYGKYIKRQITMHVHDEKNEARNGDTVAIMQTKPVSKSKTWRLVSIVKSAKGSVASGSTGKPSVETKV